MADNLIQPAAGATPPATPSPEPAPQPETPAQGGEKPGKGSIPDNVARIPAFQALLVGQPSAFSTPIKSKNPSIDAIWDAHNKLIGAGIAFYRSLSGDTGVIFNSMHIHPEALKQADQAGKLLSVAPPFETVETLLKANPHKHPILNASFQPPTTPPTAPTPTPPQSANSGLPASPGPSAPPPPASVQKGLETARKNNIMPGGPSTGMSPGAGRLLNAINKPVV